MREPRLRRLAGGALVAVGALTLALTAGRYLQGALAREALRQRWEEAQLQRDVDQLRLSLQEGGAPELAPPVGAPVAQLLIPRLGLDEVIVEGVEARQLNVGPGHLPGSALPGLPGNAIVSAHRDRHFGVLEGLRVGDTVVTDLGHRRTTWVVARRRVVQRDAPALFRTSTPTLTLTTCWPIRWFGPAPDRLIVTAVPVERTVAQR